MKKKVFLILLSVFMCLSLVGCGSKKDANSIIDDDFEQEEEKDLKKVKVDFNEETKLKSVSMKIIEVYLTDDVIPPGATGFYSHYEATAGKLYLDVIATVKNTSKKSVSLRDYFDVSAKIGKNEYSGFTVLEEKNRSDFDSFGSIDSLSTEYAHMIIEVPDNVDADDKITIQIKADNQLYQIDGSKALEKTEKIIEDNTKKISNNEVQKIDKVAEFFIEKSNIAKRIDPPNASGFYSYYEADAGKLYVDVIISYKNLNTVDVDCDELFGGVKLIYDKDYEYSGTSIVEKESRSDFTYSSITSISPLTTEYVHYLFQIPESLQNESGSMVFQFRIGDSLYQYQVR